ncbi:MAG: BatA domain-containing protein [Phycisphaerae bacterium]|jgi:hypothetical protein
MTISMTLPFLAAGFISPALFYGGAAAVAAPILIHLLARRRFRRIRWAAMDFLIDAERRNRRRIRMEEWILLLLRCLAVLMIAFMVARPFVTPEGAASLLGGARRTERLVVLDDSFSMGYESADPVRPTAFARAQEAVVRLLSSIRRETPDDTITLVRMTAPDAPVESGTYLNDIQTDDVLARLHAMVPSQRAAELPAVFEGVGDILRRNPDVTNVVVYVVSDFQRKDWNRRESSRGGGTSDPDGVGIDLLKPLREWAADDRGLRFVLINVGDAEAANLAVTEIQLQRRLLVASTTGLIRANVANFAEKSEEAVEVSLRFGHVAQSPKVVPELGPRQHASVELTTELVQSGWEPIQVEVPADGLSLDNVRYGAANVADAVRVLVVNGEPSADSFDDEVTFLVTALRPEGEVFSGNEVTVVDESQLEEARLSRFHVVVLANVYRLSEAAIGGLEQFVRGGGGLLVFLGDQVDPDLYNVALYRDGEGVLPVELTEVIRPPRPVRLKITDRLHPVMRGLAGEGDPLGVGNIAFFEFVGCVPHEGSREEGAGNGDEGTESSGSSAVPEPESLSGGGTASPIGIGVPARVLARFNDADEHPAIVERRFGQGRVVVVATAADKEWHHWADHPTYLPVIMELTQHVVGSGGAAERYEVGQPIRLTLDPAVFEADLRLRTPGYPNEREAELTAIPGSEGHGLVATWEHTESAGQYRLILRRRDGGETVRLVAVNVDSRESDLAAAGEEEIGRVMGDVPFDYIKGVERLTGVADTARIELWRGFLLIAFVALMCEQCLAWLWGRRG